MWPSAAAYADGSTTSPDWHYTMRPADSLQSVANKLLARQHSWSDLVRYNQIDDITQIQPGAILRIPVDWLKFQPKPASTLSTTGSVLIKKSRDSRFQVLKAGMNVHVGDEIATRQGTALIRFADGSLLRLEADSVLVFNKLSHYGQTGMVDTRMRLKKGALSTEVSPMVKGSRFEITTPSAVAAVRGTKFRLKTDGPSSTIEVTEGQVAFSHEHGSTVVNGGEGARIHQQKSQIERVPLKPAPAPQFAGTVQDLPATLAWESPEAAKYRYQLTDDKGQKRLRDATLSKPEAELDNLRNGEYVVAMRAVDDKGFEGLESKTPIKVDLQADIAELLAPSDGSTLDYARPQFRWSLSDETTLARLEIARDPAFSELVTDYEFATTDKTLLDRELAPGTYYWRVASLVDGSQESYSPVRTLSIRGKLKLVKILSVNYLDNQVGLFWNSVKEAQGYRLQISDSSLFNNILKEETIGKTSAHLKLTPGKRYFARVKGLGSELYQAEYGPVKELYIPEQQ
ncbi:MAG: FecR domain-containing protein [Oleiphilaceae bacterium]|nr:FecR domain-containing protein [Oleiphilaceae bacterium]